MPPNNPSSSSPSLSYSPSAPSLGAPPSFSLTPGVQSEMMGSEMAPYSGANAAAAAASAARPSGKSKWMDVANSLAGMGAGILSALPKKGGKAFNPISQAGLGAAPISGARASLIALGGPGVGANPYRSAIMDLLGK